MTISFFQTVGNYLRIFLFRIISVGPIPNHTAFIMDGNRSYAKKKNLDERAGHRSGFLSLMSTLKYCHGLGVKYITTFAFGIDEFKMRSEEVQHVMSITQEIIEWLLKEEYNLKQYGVRIHFIGNMRLLDENVRLLVKKTMMATAKNTICVLLLCVAYSSSDDITQAIQKTCRDKSDEIRASNSGKDCIFEETETFNSEISNSINSLDIGKHMYVGLTPDPDILIRTSGDETTLRNFMKWQSKKTLLLFSKALWPEFGLWHLVWAVLDFQRQYAYLQKK